MILAENIYEEFNERIKVKQVICFGCGQYFKMFALDFGKIANVVGVIDNDKLKQGGSIKAGNSLVKIYSPSDALKSYDFDQTILVITVYSFQEIVDVLNSDSSFDNVTCYIYSKLKYNNLKTADCLLKTSSTPLIPPMIHYIWFGNVPMPNHLQLCVDSWHEKCPEYKIIKWDESNYNVYKNTYTKYCHEHHEWAYLSDYARLDIIAQHGGIYLDTDVEIIRNIDELRFHSGFIATIFLGGINSGSGFGAIARHQTVLDMISDFEEQFEGGIGVEINMRRETSFFCRYGYEMNYEMQIIRDVTILPFNIMSPIIPDFRRQHITEATLGIHYYSKYIKPLQLQHKIKDIGE